MNWLYIVGRGLCLLVAAAMLPSLASAEVRDTDALGTVVAQAITPVMHRYGIPGMAVGITADGRDAIYDFGVASKATGKPVDDRTLFELGSLSKTFTATLASYAVVTRHLSLRDTVSDDFPALRGSGFDDVSLLNLGTHTPGGMPLQFPDDVTNTDSMMRYFQGWRATYAPGTTRTYANPSIGLLGLIAARKMNAPFEALVTQSLFRPLGLGHTTFAVPSSEMAHYAQGYTSADAPTRMSPGLLASEAYGIRTTASDMVRFVQANMGEIDLPANLQRAIILTHTGYYAIGAMTQDLIWEQYPFPVALQDLQDGNSAKVSYAPNPARRLDPPLAPQADVLIDKTGSTNGFGAYVAFVPGRKLGIVLLANKNYPNEARVEIAHRILGAIDASADMSAQ